MLQAIAQTLTTIDISLVIVVPSTIAYTIKQHAGDILDCQVDFEEIPYQTTLEKECWGRSMFLMEPITVANCVIYANSKVPMQYVNL